MESNHRFLGVDQVSLPLDHGTVFISVASPGVAPGSRDHRVRSAEDMPTRCRPAGGRGFDRVSWWQRFLARGGFYSGRATGNGEKNESDADLGDRAGGDAGVGESGRFPGAAQAARKGSKFYGTWSTSAAVANEIAWTFTCRKRPLAGCPWWCGFTAAAGGAAARKLPRRVTLCQGLRRGQHQLPPQPASRFPAQINDCKAAIRWLRAHAAEYRLDPDHIGVWGASAGGHLAALLGTTGDVQELEGHGGNLDQSSRVQCVVDWFGPADLTTMGRQVDHLGTPVARLIGGPVQENKEKARKASPLAYVSKDSAPFLIMHGDKDKLVPLEQSEKLAAALAKAGVEVKLQIVKDGSHFGPGFSSPENWKLIEDFFAQHLGQEKP